MSRIWLKNTSPEQCTSGATPIAESGFTIASRSAIVRGTRARRLVEHRLVVVDARRVDAPRHRQRKGPRRGLARAAEVESSGTRPARSASAGSAPRSASRPSRTHPRTCWPSIITRSDRLARRDRRARQPIPLRAAARERPDVPLDARVAAPRSRRRPSSGPARRSDRRRPSMTVIGPEARADPGGPAGDAAVRCGRSRPAAGSTARAGGEEGTELQHVPARARPVPGAGTCRWSWLHRLDPRWPRVVTSAGASSTSIVRPSDRALGQAWFDASRSTMMTIAPADRRELASGPARDLSARVREVTAPRARAGTHRPRRSRAARSTCCSSLPIAGWSSPAFLVYPLVYGLVLSLHDTQGFDLTASSASTTTSARSARRRGLPSEPAEHAGVHRRGGRAPDGPRARCSPCSSPGVRRGRTLFRFVFFAPFVLAPVAVGTVWKFLYAPFFGIVADRRRRPRARHVDRSRRSRIPTWRCGRSWPRSCGGSPASAWSSTSRRSSRSRASTTSTRVLEGAGRFQRFRQITWPLLWPQTFTLVLLTTIGTLRIFDMVWIMTAGGPVARDRDRRDLRLRDRVPVPRGRLRAGDGDDPAGPDPGAGRRGVPAPRPAGRGGERVSGSAAASLVDRAARASSPSSGSIRWSGR